jgi:hypothetical protein
VEAVVLKKEDKERTQQKSLSSPRGSKKKRIQKKSLSSPGGGGGAERRLGEK